MNINSAWEFCNYLVSEHIGYTHFNEKWRSKPHRAHKFPMMDCQPVTRNRADGLTYDPVYIIQSKQLLSQRLLEKTTICCLILRSISRVEISNKPANVFSWFNWSDMHYKFRLCFWPKSLSRLIIVGSAVQRNNLSQLKLTHDKTIDIPTPSILIIFVEFFSDKIIRISDDIKQCLCIWMILIAAISDNDITRTSILPHVINWANMLITFPWSDSLKVIMGLGNFIWRLDLFATIGCYIWLDSN